MIAKQPTVYILASKRNGTLYIGVTSDLQKRAWTHKNDLIEGFTKKDGVNPWFTTNYAKKWNRGVEAGADRGTESRLERFVGRN